MEPMSPDQQGVHLPPRPEVVAPPPFAPFGSNTGYGPVGPPPPYTPPMRSQRAGLAVAAMVCGIIGVFTFWIFGILPLLAVIFGFVSASGIKRSNGSRTGLGMARTGWVLGVLGLLGFGVFIWAAVTDRIGDGDDTKSVLDLEVGDCLDEVPGEGLIAEVTVVDCAGPHATEVYFNGELDPGRTRTFPGDTVVSDEVGAACVEQFQVFVRMDYNTSVLELYFVQASEVGWKLTRGGYTCMVYDPGKDVSGTLRNAGR